MRSKYQNRSLLIVLLATVVSAQDAAAQSATPDPDEVAYDIVERGEDFGVYRTVRTGIDDSGGTSSRTNQFTLLENCLNYFEDGRWKESEDLIEVAPDGAFARRGPNKAIFSPDLNSPAVFDILTSDGQRLRGGVRALQLTDVASGRSVTLASVKTSAPGELLPPNQIVYRNAFDGLDADVLLVWRHNSFSQDVVLREQPRLPDGMDPETTRLEVVTEMVEAPKPDLRRQTVPAGKAGEIEDDVVIHFGRLAFVMGQAFPVADGAAWTVGGLNVSDDGSPVLKQWHTAPDGRTFLIESLGWAEAQQHLKLLPPATQARVTAMSPDRKEVDRVWPERPAPLPVVRPLEVAQLGYQPDGYVVDFIIIPDSGTPPILLANTTYYIKSSYYSGASVTFQPGCCIKFKNNAYMLLYGPVSFPAAGQPMPVFTSRNDNNFGEVIQGVAGEANSNGDPALHKAAQAIWMYYVNLNSTIRNARIRWAQRGVQYDVNPGVYINHSLQSCLLEYTGTGVYANLQNATLTLSDVKKCTVTTPISCPGSCGTIYGSMIDDCGVVSNTPVNSPAQDSASGDPNKNSQSECSFVVVDSSRIVAAFFDTHLSEYGLGERPFAGTPRSTGWGVSLKGGASFTDQGAIPPTVPSTATQGDAGDPVMARDTGNGAIYLLTNPSREAGTWTGFRLWKSMDNGQTFSLFNANVPSGLTSGDKPMIAVNSFAGTANYHHLYVAGTATVNGSRGTFATYSTDGGATWHSPKLLSIGGHGADLAIALNGTVYVFYIVNGPSVGLWYSRRRTTDTDWYAPVQIAAHADSQNFYSASGNGSGNPKRSNSATTEDYFVSNAFPRAAVNPVTGRIYIVYADLPFAGSTTDRGDIFISEGIPNADGSLTISGSGVRKLNNDGTVTDQWNPSIAINPAGTQLFVGYYSRQADSANNAWIKAYGAKANLANGLVTATFDVFPISSTASPPLFPGTATSTPPANTWMYDHVWAQAGVCLNTSAVVAQCPAFQETLQVYQHFMADDYTWAVADGSYFYYGWCDRSDIFTQGGNSRPDPNIRLGKMKQ